MRIAIIGAELHGIEATYLAKKAGFETFVIGKKEGAPALSMADDYVIMDPVAPESNVMRVLRKCDAVLPACENVRMLTRLNKILEFSNLPLLFDIDAYLISSSKNASNAMMEKIGVPTPRKWQDCGYPVIVKPSSQSGGAGVTIAHNDKEVNEGIGKIMGMGDEPLIQEYVSGKCISVEVIGDGHNFKSFAVNEGRLSENYDCKMVKCSPNILRAEVEREFRHIAEKMAEIIDLGAVMNVEAIITEKGLKVIEMDARIPTQAPTAVLAATGVNLLKEMTEPVRRGRPRWDKRASAYEHFIISEGKMATCGEVEFAKMRAPKILRGLFGSDEMITDYEPGAAVWRCGMINSAASNEELETKRRLCIEKMMDECKIKEFIDVSPPFL
ncbi:MAG: 3-methylornithine--L-lysine ligase PylC [Methanomassiliicoccaceae archaeon]|jgi:pyrrolysine biosynthesis protein PylC|nr:3-methylornithine--L-lysine ligase PylC [Methanomassiliicoccaceae archaeon]